MEKIIITSPNSPKAIGPYSHAVRHGNTLYVSGQIGLDPKTGEFSSNNIQGQTEQCLINLKNILESGGSSLDHVLKATVLLSDIGDFGEMNTIYAKYFTKNFPARAAYSVKGLPKNALVEIEAIAMIKEEK
eukprot:TRINITY_DN1438_c0_g1_i2.p1 TRINITY_DN1438_c0_g1~~TRINITY_DN1438_c0_g1_i2.p1  ORF type:complete len:131 (-),score=40.82 TRINITY_DN1438_c0_g1_i2:65-457(-)